MAATTKPLWHSSVRSCTVFFGCEPALVDIRRDAAIDARRVAGRARVATDFVLPLLVRRGSLKRAEVWAGFALFRGVSRYPPSQAEFAKVAFPVLRKNTERTFIVSDKRSLCENKRI